MMRFYYADSSVLVKRHVTESGSRWFRHLVEFGSDHVITSSQISEVEVWSALSRRMRAAHMTTREYQEVLADFNYVCAAEYRLTSVSRVVVNQAKHLLERQTLRAYDAIQLASAILTAGRLVDIQQAQFTFLAADTRLLDAADSEGLRTFNPDNVE